jgi:hypothetical protein
VRLGEGVPAAVLLELCMLYSQRGTHGAGNEVGRAGSKELYVNVPV